eukprot:scaffold584477_cov48-Prasinocladus_malaysianus.AAC.1
MLATCSVIKRRPYTIIKPCFDASTSAMLSNKLLGLVFHMPYIQLFAPLESARNVARLKSNAAHF